MQMIQMKEVRKQLKGINRQVKGIRRQLMPTQSPRSGMLVGLLLLGASCIAGAMMLSKSGARTQLKQMFRSGTEDVSKQVSKQVSKVSKQLDQLGQAELKPAHLLEKIQAPFISLFEQAGFKKAEAQTEETEAPVKASANGKKGGNSHKAETKPHQPIQTMGDV